MKGSNKSPLEMQNCGSEKRLLPAIRFRVHHISCDKVCCISPIDLFLANVFSFKFFQNLAINIYDLKGFSDLILLAYEEKIKITFFFFFFDLCQIQVISFYFHFNRFCVRNLAQDISEITKYMREKLFDWSKKEFILNWFNWILFYHYINNLIQFISMG